MPRDNRLALQLADCILCNSLDYVLESLLEAVRLNKTANEVQHRANAQWLSILHHARDQCISVENDAAQGAKGHSSQEPHERYLADQLSDFLALVVNILHTQYEYSQDLASDIVKAGEVQAAQWAAEDYTPAMVAFELNNLFMRGRLSQSSVSQSSVSAPPECPNEHGYWYTCAISPIISRLPRELLQKSVASCGTGMNIRYVMGALAFEEPLSAEEIEHFDLVPIRANFPSPTYVKPV